MYSQTFGKSKRCSPTMKVEDIFPSNNHGDFKIIGYFNATNIKVQFLETDEIGYATATAIRRGQVKPYEEQ